MILLLTREDKHKSGIYKITNIANNKVYIGQSIDLWTRINEGYLQKLPKSKGHNIHLQRAWDKYGSDNFKFEIIEYVNNINDLNERETFWIHEYKAYDKNYGYNILPIGGSPRGVVKSEESKIKQSLAVSGSKNGMYGKTHTDEVRKILSDKASVPIVQLDIKGNLIREWDSITLASEYYNIDRAPITSVLRKRNYTSCGFVWVYKDEYDSGAFDIKTHFKNKVKRKVIQLSIFGEVINEFDSIADAQKETKVKNIVVVCQGHNDIAGGFVWMYKEDYLTNGFNHKKYRTLQNRYGKIIQISLNGEYIRTWNNAEEVAQSFGCEANQVRSCCSGYRKRTLGYIWLFELDYKEYGVTQDRFEYKSKVHGQKPVVQLSLDGTYINKFNSVKEAFEKTGIIASNISRICKNKGKTTGGFKWMYLEEYNKYIN